MGPGPQSILAHFAMSAKSQKKFCPLDKILDLLSDLFMFFPFCTRLVQLDKLDEFNLNQSGMTVG